jgi:murein L,D-transpeptidase YcbB/YkuD
MLPAARRDPGYFAAHEIEVLEDVGELRAVDPATIDWQAVTPERFPFRLRQPPGPRNPLGRIKFEFANPYSVYLHGTPSAAAFERPLRALSHGCVRVEDEIALAMFALAPDPAWSRERLDASLLDDSERRLPLAHPLPVYLVYFTAAADAAGAVSFTGDLYGWDRALALALGPDAGSGRETPGGGSPAQ